ncbi:nicotinate-nucleotide adenylyltransferase [Halobacillus litoralis]|uniref:nicotinate-nucleotide adenylyltransferase n=1 Tax=Halobacillus litoralis TaxID=45668 RepID=UPI001CD7F8F7|nr:nicotinate-nucleotide adenylyltransferase [Halobacillus litoralis]MCA1021455.1 nicotinate-nucleotide adenylyltransferase [Halobacillus litoralis]
MKKIGILGGTFDPPHYGHLLMAEYCREDMGLDEVWFMPSYIPPHKKESQTDAELRLEMVERSIAGHPDFRLCNIELVRKGTSYTYDTLTLLNNEYPDHHFFFIIGGDMVQNLPQWYKIKELKTIVDFVGVKRPGYEWNPEADVHYVDIPGVDVSSTMIREKLKNGKSVRYLVPEAVDSYIKEHHLYGNDS